MRYSSKLARLEKLAGRASCPSCRLSNHDLWPDPARPDPGPFAVTVCELCGARDLVSLARYDEEQRTILRLCFRGLEHLFTDPRAWAAQRWLSAHSHAKRLRKKPERQPQPEDNSAPPSIKGSRSERPGMRLRRRLNEDAAAAIKSECARLRARYGENPFPDIDARLTAARGPDFEGAYRFEPFEWAIDFMRLRELKAEADAWAGCAEAERIILGQVRVQTEEALASCERLALELADEARRKHEDRETEWEQERAKNRSFRQIISGREARPSVEVSPASPEQQTGDAPVDDSSPRELTTEELLAIFEGTTS